MDVKKTINELTANKRKYDDFLETLSVEDQRAVEEASSRWEFTKALEKHILDLTPREKDELYEFKKDKDELYRQATEKTTQSIEKKENNHQYKEHRSEKMGEEENKTEERIEKDVKIPQESATNTNDNISQEASGIHEGKTISKPTEASTPPQPTTQKLTRSYTKTHPVNVTTKTSVRPMHQRIHGGRSSFPGRPGGPKPLRRRGLGTAGRIGKRAVGKGSKKAAMAAGRAALTNPYVLLGLGIVIAVIVVLFFTIALIQDTCEKFSDPFRYAQEYINDPDGMTARTPIWAILVFTNACPDRAYDADVPANPPGVKTEKSGPLKIDNGENLEYNVSVTYDPYADGAISPEAFNEMSLFDVPAFNYSLVSTTGVLTEKTDPEGDDYMQYSFSNNPECIENRTCNFIVVIKSPGSDFVAVNTVYAAQEYTPVSITFRSDFTTSPDGGTVQTVPSGDLTEGRNAIPSNRTCGGKWRVTAEKKNFGDPVCSYTPARFSAYLKEIAPANDVVFFEDISRTEGSDPRVGGNINKGTASGWGTFQMGPKRDTMHNHSPGNWGFKPYWDHGDVPWQRQIEFAVARNNYWEKNFDGNFMYWGTAYCLCYFDFYRDKNGWCDDIRRNKAVRCPESCFSGAAYCSARTDAVGKERNGSINCSAHACYTGIGDSRVNRNTGKGW